ncbi:MAG: SurA N-terminal domain-containing protein [Rikenellaceae bacterium]
MAALNTLRTKGGVVLSIIIGISLIAFLLGDWNRMGAQKSVVIGKINGDKVDYQAYMSNIDRLTNAEMFLTGQSSLSAEATEKVQNDAWQQMVVDKVVVSDFEKLGVYVSEEEMVDMTTGNFVSPVLSSIFVSASRQFDKEMMENFVSNLDKDESGRARKFWTYIETQMSQERAISKYNNIVKQGIFVTDLEVAAGVRNANTVVNIDYVSQPTSIIADSTVSVSDAQMREFYKNNIARYKRNAGRDIRYVVFEALPSPADYKAAEETFNSLNEEFKISADPIQFVNLNSEQNFSPKFLAANELPAGMAEQAAGASVGYMFPTTFVDDVYTSAKVTAIKNMPDSLSFSFVVVPMTLNVDSLVNLMNAPKANFDTEINNVIAQVPAVQPAQSVNMSTSELNDMMLEKMSDAPVGKVVSINNGQVAQIMKITKRGKVIPKLQLAELISTVVPSPETEQLAYANATAFVNKVKNVETFNKVASDDALLVRSASLSSQSNKVDGIDGSREIVRWAFTSEKNALSHVVSIENKNIVACLVDVVKEGTATFEEAKEEVKMACISEKKGEMLASEMAAAGSMDAIAAKYGLTIGSAMDINFDAFFVQGLGVAPSVIGAVTSLGVNKVSKPIVSAENVTVAKVTSVANTNEVNAMSEKALLEAQAATNIEGRLFGALISGADIVDERVLYF